jgi:hypothetical protein
MKTSFSLSSTQFAFISAIRKVSGSCALTRKNTCNGCSISFSALRDAALAAGYAAVPAWCMTPSRKCGRGVYTLPELFAEDADITVTATKRGRPAGSKTKTTTTRTTRTPSAPAPAPVPQPAMVAAVTSAPPSRMTTDAVVNMARSVSNGESDTFTPSVDPNYIPWGYHNEIKTIIKSARFCPVFITGLSGNGKTTMVEQVCAQLKRECIRVNFTSQTDEDELLGGFRLIAGETVFVPGPVLVAMERGAVLLLDEIDLGTHLIMCLQSVLEGKGKYIPKIGKYVRPAEGFTIVATANTKGKGSDDGRFVGTNHMNEAFLDRFAFTYEQDYADPKVETRILTKYAESLGVSDDAFITNLVGWADLVRKSFKQNIVSEIITTRRLRDVLFAYSVLRCTKAVAVERCLARFDNDTKEAFMQFYTKVDAEASNPNPAADSAPTAVDTASTVAPF